MKGILHNVKQINNQHKAVVGMGLMFQKLDGHASQTWGNLEFCGLALVEL